MNAIFGKAASDPRVYFVWFVGEAFFKNMCSGWHAVVDDFGNLVAVRSFA